jgi:hypothetical protein
MQQYLITVWEDGGKYSYVMGTNNIDSVKKDLNKRYNRYTVVARGTL